MVAALIGAAAAESAKSTINAFGSITSGKAAAAASKHNARIAEFNRRVSLSEAATAEIAQRTISGRQQGALRAAIGATGFSGDVGFSNIVADSAATAEVNALLIRHKGALEAAGFKQTAALERQRAKSQLISGFIGAGSALIGGASNVFKLAPQTTGTLGGASAQT